MAKRLITTCMIVMLLSQYALAGGNGRAPANYYDQHRWSFLYYYGRTAQDVVGKLLTFHFTSANEVVQTFEVSYLPVPDNAFRAFFHPVVSAVEFALGYSHRSANANQGTIEEIDPYLLFRWTNLPFQQYVLATIGFGEGVSYTTSPPAIEFDTGDVRTQRLLNYLMLELTLSPPRYPQFQLVGRLHHRSGGYGLFGAGNSGSNTIGLGIRYRF